MFSLKEGSTVDATFNVTPALAEATTVFYVVDYDDADAGDHELLSGRVRLPAGATAGAIRVSILDDADVELPRETFTLRLIPPPGVVSPAYTPELGSEIRVNIEEGVCDRTPQIRDFLTGRFIVFGVRDCSQITEGHLDNVGNVLLLSFQGITSLKENDFSRMTGTSILFLAQNSLTTLPSGVFNGLENLAILTLAANRLTALSPGVFNGLGNLTTLTLNENRLTALSPGVFDGLGSLESLTLQNQYPLSSTEGLTELPAGVFSKLGSLKTLRLDGNRLAALPPGVFSGLSGLQALHLHDNLGAPFRSVLRYEPAGGTQGLPAALPASEPVSFRLTLREGAPYPLKIDFEASGVSLSTDVTVIPAGSTQSEAFTVTGTPGETSFSIGFAGLLAPPEGCAEEQRYQGRCFTGFEIAGAPLVYAEGGAGPQVTTIRFTSAPQNSNVYLSSLEETLTVDVVFDRDLIVEYTVGASPTLTLQVGSNTRTAIYVPGRSGGAVLSFDYAIRRDDVDENGVSIADEGLRLNHATVTDVFSRDADLTLAPRFLDDFSGHRVFYRISFLSFQRNLFEVGEGETADAIFDVSPALEETTTVFYVVEYGVADAADHEPLSGKVELLAGAESGTVRISIRDDTNAEPPRETFDLRFAVPDAFPYALGETPEIRVIIQEGVCDRTPQIRDYLTGLFRHHCPDTTASFLGALRDLDLSGREITSLKENDFSYMPNLMTLFLDQNRLTALPAGVFSKLGSLKTLRLDGNRLAALPPGVFSGLSGLHALHLHDNPGAPFRLTLHLEPAAGAQDLSAALLTPGPAPVRLTLREGAPYSLEVDFEASGVESFINPVTISAGGTQSETFTVTRVPGETSFEIGFAEPPPDQCPDSQKHQEQCFAGFEIVGSPIVYAEGGTGPRVSTVGFTSVPQNPGAYFSNLEETVAVDVVFDRGLIVEHTAVASPTLALQVGETSRTAIYVPGRSGGDVLSFEYTIRRDDADEDGISIAADGLQLNDATVTDVFSRSADVTLGSQFLAGFPGHKVYTAFSLSLSFQSDSFELRENEAVDVGFDVSPAPAETITVFYVVNYGTAAEDDHEPLSESVELPAGATAGTVRISIVDDDLAEPPNETFSLSLTLPPPASPPPLYTLTEQSEVTINIKEGICDRTLQVQAAILAKLAGGYSCDAVAHENLTGITGILSLRNAMTAGLKEGDFSGLTRVETLDLRANRLSTLTAGVFSGLDRLRELRLQNNRSLSTLTAGVFGELNNLQSLRLSLGGLTELPDGVFSENNQLQLLFLDDNQLRELPNEVFFGLSKLRNLVFNDNRLTRIPAGAFSSYGELLTLRFHNNPVRSLPRGVFSGLAKLEWLNLRNTRLTKLPPGVFSGLSRLKALHLGDNPAGDFPGEFRLRLRLELADGSQTSLPMPPRMPPRMNLRATLREGAPYPLTLEIQASNGELSATELMIAVGETQSGSVTLFPHPGATSATVEFVSSPLSPPSPPECVQGQRVANRCFDGFQIVLGSSLVLDDEPTTVSSVVITSSPAQGDIYIGGDLGEEIVVEVVFGQAVEVLQSETGRGPSLALVIGRNTRLAAYDENQSSGNVVVFRYKPQSGDGDNDGISVPADALQLNGARILDRGVPVSAGLGDHAVENAVGHKVENVEAICDRTPQVQAAILAKLAGIDDCAAVVDEDLFGVTGILDMRDTELTDIREGDFSGLSRVETLDLRINRLSALSAGVFGGLDELRELRLQNNRSLTTLPTGVFDGLSNLEILRLGPGGLIELPDGVFAANDRLQILALNDNQLRELPREVFFGLGKLRNLVLHDNRLLRIPAGAFSGYSELLILRLNDNPVGALPRGVFSDLTKLTWLNLSNTGLTKLPVGVFSGLSGLQALHLGGNPVGDFSGEFKLRLRLELAGDAQVPSLSGFTILRATLRDGAPYPLTLEIRASDGELSSTEMMVATGSTQSESVTLFPRPGASSATVEFVSLSPSSPPLGCVVAQRIGGRCFDGFEIVLGSPLVLGDEPTTVSSVAITSSPLEGDIYIGGGAGEEIVVEVAFGQAVEVLQSEGGRWPSLVLVIGRKTRFATYDDHQSAGNILVFRYKPRNDDGDADGISVPADALRLNGARILDRGVSVSAGFGVRAIENAAGHKVENAEAICDRTPQVRAAILAKLAGIDDCAAVGRQGLMGVTGGLDLSSTMITGLREGDFSGLTWVETLDLSGNPLSALPSGVFNGLISLRILRLSTIGLTELPDSVFAENNQLLTLVLNGNQLRELPDGVFSGLSKLRNLVFNDNPLGALPRGVFSGLAKLEWLNLMNTRLTGLPPGAFSGVSGLKALHLSGDSGDDFDLLLRFELAVAAGTPTSGSVPAPVTPGMTLRATLREGAPYPLTLAIRASDGELSSTEMMIVTGSTQSESVTLFPRPGASSATVEFVSLSPSSPPLECVVAQRIGGRCFDGFEIVLGSPLVLGDEPTTVSSVAITSSPLGGDIYIGGGAGEEIVVEVAFGQAVEVLQSEGGRWPSLVLVIGKRTRLAAYDESQSAGNTLVFRYKPQTRDADGDGISVPADALRLNGARILDRGVPVSAELGDRVIENDAGHKVKNVEAICDRTPQVQAAILVKLAGIDDCDGVVDEDLLGITGVLNLQGTTITDLREGDFAGLTRVEILDLRVNRLSMLAAGVFSGLDGLRELRLQNNPSLSTLPVGIFSRLDNLQSLRLGPGGLTELPDGVFAENNQLKTLVLANNRLRELPNEVFFGLSDLQNLVLHNNGLTWIPPGAFSGYGELLTLRLNDNPVESLPPGVFSGLAKLTWLSLSNTGLTGLPPGVFSGLRNLQALHLTENPAGDFPGGFSLQLRLELAGDAKTPSLAFSLEPIQVTLWATLREGAPYLLPLEIQASAGELSSTGVRIRGGSTRSESVSLFLSPGTSSARVEFVSLPPPPPSGCVIQQQTGGRCFDGFNVVLGSPLVLDNEPAMVSGIAIISSPMEGDAYIGGASGEEIVVEVAFRQEVEVLQSEAGRWPSLALAIGRSTRLAIYDENQSAGNILVFRYKPQAREADGDGISVPEDALRLNGARILHQGVAAFLGFGDRAIENAAGHKVSTAGAICDRTSQVQAVILERLAGIDDCNAVLHEDLLGVTGTLGLASERITSLQAGDFSGLTAVTRLYLQDNSLTTLPSGIFMGLDRLRELRLDNNQFHALPAGLFLGVQDLSKVNLDGNPGRLFTLTPRLQRTGLGDGDPPQVNARLTLAEGAPFEINVGFEVTGGDGSVVPESDRIRKGDIQSDGIVLITQNSAAPVRVTLSASTVPDQGLLGDGTVECTSECYLGLVTDDGEPFVIDIVAPSVSGAAFRSTPASGDTYVAQDGETISVGVRFDEDVAVSSGTPVLRLDVGGTMRDAPYDPSLSSSTELVFSYRLAPGDSDDDGVGFAANALALNGARITDLHDNNARLELGTSAVTDDPAHKVVSRIFSLRFEPSETAVKPGGSTEVKLILGNAGALTAGEEIIVTLASGASFDASLQRPSLGLPPNSSMMVTLSAAADILPDSSTLTASGALPGARVVPGELTVTVLEREITVLFEPAEVELPRDASDPASSIVQVKTEPALVRDEVVVLTFVALDDRGNQIDSAAAYAEPSEVRLQAGHDSAEVRVFSSNKEIALVRPQRDPRSTVDERKLRLGDLRVIFPNAGLQLRVKVFLEGALE